MSSPQAWGCFRLGPGHPLGVPVFPTGVGMFLTAKRSTSICTRLPHRRGDVSPARSSEREQLSSSPQAWGCFFLDWGEENFVDVFPTGVGMFPFPSDSAVVKESLPHRRGDVSSLPISCEGCLGSSPQAWGCFPAKYAAEFFGSVFPTGVGMFLRYSMPRAVT